MLLLLLLSCYCDVIVSVHDRARGQAVAAVAAVAGAVVVGGVGGGVAAAAAAC